MIAIIVCVGGVGIYWGSYVQRIVVANVYQKELKLLSIRIDISCLT